MNTLNSVYVIIVPHTLQDYMILLIKKGILYIAYLAASHFCGAVIYFAFLCSVTHFIVIPLCYVVLISVQVIYLSEVAIYD